MNQGRQFQGCSGSSFESRQEVFRYVMCSTRRKPSSEQIGRRIKSMSNQEIFENQQFDFSLRQSWSNAFDRKSKKWQSSRLYEML